MKDVGVYAVRLRDQNMMVKYPEVQGLLMFMSVAVPKMVEDAKSEGEFLDKLDKLVAEFAPLKCSFVDFEFEPFPLTPGIPAVIMIDYAVTQRVH
jgi:hypothetical protein